MRTGRVSKLLSDYSSDRSGGLGGRSIAWRQERFVVEFWRINPAVGFGLSEAQWFSAVLIISGLWKTATTR